MGPVGLAEDLVREKVPVAAAGRSLAQSSRECIRGRRCTAGWSDQTGRARVRVRSQKISSFGMNYLHINTHKHIRTRKRW